MPNWTFNDKITEYFRYRWTFNPAVLTRVASSEATSRGSGDVSSSREESKFEVIIDFFLFLCEIEQSSFWPIDITSCTFVSYSL